MTYETTAIMSSNSIVLFVLAILLLTLVGIGSNVLLGFCVYNDAQYRRNRNAVLWALLSGFSGIAALVYIIVQVSAKSKPMRCEQCGEWLAPDSLFCPRCGRTLMVHSPEQMNKFNKRRKLFLGLWIGSLVFVLIFSVVFTVLVISQMANYMEFMY